MSDKEGAYPRPPTCSGAFEIMEIILASCEYKAYYRHRTKTKIYEAMWDDKKRFSYLRKPVLAVDDENSISEKE